jgi:hypothetical protein
MIHLRRLPYSMKTGLIYSKPYLISFQQYRNLIKQSNTNKISQKIIFLVLDQIFCEVMEIDSAVLVRCKPKYTNSPMDSTFIDGYKIYMVE